MTTPSPSPVPPPTWRIFLGDTVRGVIGYVVVFSAIASFLVAVFAFDKETSDTISAFFASVLGVVMGFFFGRQGIDRAEKETVAALREKDALVKDTENVDVDDLVEKAEKAELLAAEYDSLLELADKQDAAFKRKFEGLLEQLEERNADRAEAESSEEDQG